MVTPRKRLTQQKSLRLPEEQDRYIQEQLALLRRSGTTGAFIWSEADVIRAIIERARREGLSVADLTEAAIAEAKR